MALLFLAVDVEGQIERILQLPDDTQKVNQLLDMGYTYEKHHPDSSLAIYEIAGRIGKNIGYELGYGKSLNYRGIVEFERGNYARSEDLYLRSIEVFRKIGYYRGIAASYNNIGNIYLQLGDFDRSIENHLKALAIFEEIGDTVSRIHNLNNLGTMFFDNKQYARAAGYLRESVGLSRMVRNHPGLKDSYLTLSNTCRKMGDTLESYHYLKEAHLLVNEQDDPYGAHLFFGTFSQHKSDSGKYSEALVYAARSLELAKITGNPYNITRALMNTGDKYFQLKKFDQAKKVFDQALELALTNQFNETLEILYHNRARLLAAMNRFSDAYLELERLHAIRDTLYRRDRQLIIQELEAKFQNAKIESMLTEQEVTILEQNHRVERQRSMITWILVTLGGVIFTFFLGIAYIQQRRNMLRNRLQSLERENEIRNMKYLIEGEEKERMRLARELHDGVNGSLGAIKLLANSGIQKSNGEYKGNWDKIASLIDEVSEEVREISHNLMPAMLVQLDLKEAVQSYLRKVSLAAEPEIDFQCYGDFSRIEKSIQVTLYRVIQELVRNVIKHANATECIIQLNRHETAISLIVEDNGSGFDVYHFTRKRQPAGIGLQNIRSRIGMLGGTVDIQSTLDTGTEVHIRIPIELWNYDQDSHNG